MIHGTVVGLQAYYPVIDQSGIDALAISGDLTVKFEGMSRGGYGERYHAFNAGIEKTLVGVLGTPIDLGVVIEYMHDERGDDAINTLFEHDVAFGGRFTFNDFADTRALVGVVADTQNSDLIYVTAPLRNLLPTRRISHGVVYTHLVSLKLVFGIQNPDFLIKLRNFGSKQMRRF